MTTPTAHPPLLVVCDYSLRYLGGAQTALVRQAHALAATGTVILLAPDAEAVPAVPGLVPVGVPTRFVLPGLGLPILESRRRLCRRVEEVVDRYRPAGVVVHSEFALAAAALAVARGRGIRSAHVVHTFFWTAPPTLNPLAPVVRVLHRVLTGIAAPAPVRADTRIQAALRTMTLTVARCADVVVSPSRHQGRALQAAGVDGVRVLSNVVEDVPAPAGLSPQRPLTLVWAARFAPEKRLALAREAVAQAARRLGPGRIRLEVAGGEGPRSEGVRWHGRVDPERVGALIEGADAVLITSLGFDNQPMVALEGFARARPAIVLDPALAEEFGEASVCAAGTDASALADLIVRLAQDRSVLQAAARAAARYARLRRPDEHARRLRALIAAPDERGCEQGRPPHPSRRFTGIPLSP